MRNPTQPTLFGREPVMVLALAEAVLAAAVGFGLDLSGQQVGLLMAVAVALIGVVTRSRVSPVD